MSHIFGLDLFILNIHLSVLFERNGRQILLLDENLSLLISQDSGELVLVLVLLLHIANLRLTARLFEIVMGGHLVSADSHVKRGANFVELQSAVLDLAFVDGSIYLEVLAFDDVLLAIASEDDNAGHLGDIYLLGITQFEKV